MKWYIKTTDTDCALIFAVAKAVPSGGYDPDGFPAHIATFHGPDAEANAKRAAHAANVHQQLLSIAIDLSNLSIKHGTICPRGLLELRDKADAVVRAAALGQEQEPAANVHQQLVQSLRELLDLHHDGMFICGTDDNEIVEQTLAVADRALEAAAESE